MEGPVLLASSFLLALGLAWYLTPLVRTAALDFGVVDKPDGSLKQHARPTPYLGGIAVYLSFLTTLCFVFDFTSQLVGLLLGGTMMAMLGLFDDLKVLPAHLKLAGQLLVVWVMIRSGILIELAGLPYVAKVALTLFWVVGITNALNIIDVSDGLATSVCIVASCAFGLVFAWNGEASLALAAFAMGGSTLGFLWFNASPAQIFLGDTGSMFLGFMLAAFGMIGDYSSEPWIAPSIPLLILLVPILEVSLVSIARTSKGMSPLRGSPDHFAHRLKARGWNAAQVAVGAGIASLLGATLGLMLLVFQESVAVWCLTTGAVVFVGLLGALLAMVPRPAK